MDGEYAIENGNGQLILQVSPIKFASSKLQPKQLFPPLAALENVNGQIHGKATIRVVEKGCFEK